MLDVTKPVQTRDGRPARVLCWDVKGRCPVVAAISEANGSEVVRSYTAEGLSPSGEGFPGDLINVPVKHKREFWVIHYVDANREPVAWRTNPATELALVSYRHRPDVLAITHHVVEFQEGDGL